METPIPSIAIPKQAVQPTSVRQRSYHIDEYRRPATHD